jgi:hypothetical protein
VNNFFGFPKPRKAGFGSPDIPSVDVPPLDTSMEDVVLEGVIVDFGELPHRPGMFDPLSAMNLPDEDIHSFLQRMTRIGTSDLPGRYTQDDVSGTILVDADAVEDMVKKTMDVPLPVVEDAESVEDMLTVMGNENEKLQNFIDDAMKNIKR